jgi:hypothetical protein
VRLLVGHPKPGALELLGLGRVIPLGAAAGNEGGAHPERNWFAGFALIKRDDDLMLRDRWREKAVTHPTLRVGPSDRLQIDGNMTRVRHRILDRHGYRAMRAVRAQSLVQMCLEH